MAPALSILLGIFTTASFGCLALYIYLLYARKKSFFKKTADFQTSGFTLQAFLTLAAYAFFTSLYKGAASLLWWMPDAGFVSAVFALFAGAILIAIVHTAAQDPEM